MAKQLPDAYLHTRGSAILDENDTPVRLAGVNWYGFDCISMVAGGLDHQPLDAICRQIADLGFNTVRLPFCVQVVQQNPVIDRYLDAQPSLRGKPALAIMDAIVDAAGRHGLKIILDSHRAEPGWSTQENGLWYSRAYPEPAWLDSWERLVRRYLDNPTVIGCDLHNEPGSPPLDPDAWPANGGALWGYGDSLFGGRPRDWAAAATRAGNRILHINPNLLIFVEGVREDPAGPRENNTSYWPGGNLTGVAHTAFPRRLAPVQIILDVPERLVYSIHDYGPAMYRGLPWCQPGTTATSPDACNAVWDHTWGFIIDRSMAPILVGEFGTPNGRKSRDADAAHVYTNINDRNPQGNWFSYLVDYIGRHNLHWTYWCLNGTQSEAPGRHPEQIEGYGVLDPSWNGVASEPLMEKLRSIQ